MTYQRIANILKLSSLKPPDVTANNDPKDYLGYQKDRVDEKDKSSIYEIQRSSCNLKYIGQTRRSIRARFKEHLAHLHGALIVKRSPASVHFNLVRTSHALLCDLEPVF